MLCEAMSAIRALFSGIGSRAKDRRNLSDLYESFLKAEGQDELLARYGLGVGGGRLALLTALAKRTDGWHRASSLLVDRPARELYRLLGGLAASGLIRARPLRGLALLSDSGRYVLILCAERILGGLPEGGKPSPAETEEKDA
ncbi:MAG: hypothetical protein LBF40_08530 [Deltaproteobacteria bacterium]|jgi:hypothetical protein|nr:hypothetical protein [Deltaproteobacteria bacterium]